MTSMWVRRQIYVVDGNCTGICFGRESITPPNSRTRGTSMARRLSASSLWPLCRLRRIVLRWSRTSLMGSDPPTTCPPQQAPVRGSRGVLKRERRSVQQSQPPKGLSGCEPWENNPSLPSIVPVSPPPSLARLPARKQEPRCVRHRHVVGGALRCSFRHAQKFDSSGPPAHKLRAPRLGGGRQRGHRSGPGRERLPERFRQRQRPVAV